MERDRQILELFVEGGAQTGLDLGSGSRNQPAAQVKQAGFDGANRQHRERKAHHGLLSSVRLQRVDQRAQQLRNVECGRIAEQRGQDAENGAWQGRLRIRKNAQQGGRSSTLFHQRIKPISAAGVFRPAL